MCWLAGAAQGKPVPMCSWAQSVGLSEPACLCVQKTLCLRSIHIMILPANSHLLLFCWNLPVQVDSTGMMHYLHERIINSCPEELMLLEKAAQVGICHVL